VGEGAGGAGGVLDEGGGGGVCVGEGAWELEGGEDARGYAEGGVDELGFLRRGGVGEMGLGRSVGELFSKSWRGRKAFIGGADL